MTKNNKNITVSVKKILRVIDSCETDEDIDKCKILIDNYIKSAKKNRIDNLDDLKNRLNENLLYKQECIYLSRIFNKDNPIQ